MINQKDFIPKTIRVDWLKGIQTESFDSAVEAAGAWIEAESIDVINIETIVLPIGESDDTESPAIVGYPALSRQFIRVWYRQQS